MRFLKIAKTNVECAKKLKVYLCLRYRRKRQFMQTLLTHILSIIPSKKHPRSNWVKLRSQSFWYENIRMSNDAFNLLCNTLRPHISKEDTRFRKCIPAEIKLAATLYYLSGASDCRTITNLFGLGRSTVCSIVHTVCKQIVRNLLKTYINLPKRDETRRIIQKFESVSGFPQAVATIDCCHIRLKAPNKNPEDYMNRKEYHSIVLQGLVDNRYLFRDILIGWSGKSHEAIIFRNSPLYKEFQKRSFLAINMLKQIGNVELSPLILGDSAYFLENLLMKPSSDRGNLSPDEARFNRVLF